MPYILEKFGSTPIPNYNGRHDVSTATAEARGVQLSTGGEYDLYGDDVAPAEAMTITASGWLLGVNLEDDFRALRARARAKDVLWRLWDDGTREWTKARLLAVPGEKSRENLRRVQPNLTFWIPLPLWYAETPGAFLGVDLFDQDGQDLATVGAENDAVDGTSTFYVANEGNLPVTKVVITITSGTGTITAVTITNTTTGHVLTWAGILTTGEELVINAGIERVTVDGTADWSGLTEPTNKECWFELAPGPNVITLAWTDSATDDSSTAAINFEHTSA